MSRKLQDFQVIESSGVNYPNLAIAQQASRVATAHDLAATIRELLASGQLVQRNGRIEPNA